MLDVMMIEANMARLEELGDVIAEERRYGGGAGRWLRERWDSLRYRKGHREERDGEDSGTGEPCRRAARVISRTSRRHHLDTRTALTKYEAAIRNQLALSGDAAVEAAGRALIASLEPATRQLAWDLAEQAASEVDSQLSYGSVEVTLKGGEPHLGVRESEGACFEVKEGAEDARITLRLPSNLKETIEQAARRAGDSVNSYLVKDLSRSAKRGGKSGKSFKGTVRS